MLIEQITLTGNDDRGYTAEYDHERNGLQLLLFRKAGSISGRHYHKGTSATKNPEILILLNGTCTFNWRHIDDKSVQTAVVTAPAKVTISPMVWHELIPDTDCVLIEQNSIEEHKADTFYLP